MPLSPRILRGLNVKGWKVYEPRVREEEGPGDDLADNEIVEEQLPPPPTREEMEMERAEILATARQAGEQLRREALAKADKEATALRKKAEQEGYQEGFSRGEQEAAKLIEEAVQTLEAAKEEYRALLDGAQGEMLRIAVSMAEKLLNVKLELNEAAILAMVNRCLETLPGGSEVVLRVSPPDEPLCQRKAQDLQALLRKDVSLQIVADETIPDGSCSVESEESEVIFHLQKELEILTNKLLRMAVK